MSWFNYIGLIFVVVILIPNIIYAIKCKDGFVNPWKNKTVEILEQVGRYGCLVFMIFNIPYTWFDFWFDGAIIAYIIINCLLAVAYCDIWIFCFRSNSMFKALSLAIIPSVMFLVSGVLITSVPLIVMSLLFATCHILLSYQGAIHRDAAPSVDLAAQ